MASRANGLNLRDSLLNTPKIYGHLTQFESTLVPFKDYVTLLRDTFQACHLHQEKVGEGTRALANLLSSIDSELGEKAGSNTFAQLGRYQTELYSCQEMLNSQLQNAVINRMSALLEEDMDNIHRLKEAYDSSRLEHEYAMAKFSRSSKRRDADKSRFEANAELYIARKKFYQCTLDYSCQLNEFQLKKKFLLLEPILTFMHAQMGYFKACHEIMNSGFELLITGLNGDIQSYHQDYEIEVRELNQQKTELELQFSTLCIPDPDLSDPFTEFPTANTNLTSKYGYLYLRIQKSGLAAKWERTFFFTKNGNLYTQSHNKTAEALLHLKESEAFNSDCDDRRYVMQITHPTLKKPVFLQAENDTQRTEWLSVIKNNSLRKHGATMGGQGSDATRLRTRLYDSLERERIRTWATKESQQETSSTLSSTKTSSSSVAGLKTTTLPIRKSPLRSISKMTPQSGNTSKSNQRTLGILSRSGKKSPIQSHSTSAVTTHPPGIDITGSKFADVESWVHSTTAVGGAPLPPSIPAPYQPTSANTSNPTTETSVHVKYLGQKEVQDPKNSSIITGTIRGVVAARAVKKVRPATSIELTIQLRKITLTDVQSNKAVGGFLLKDIVNCSAHHEDEKLFGIICRTANPAEPERVKYICHVMQADQSGSQVCGIISNAIQRLWKIMQNKGTSGQKDKSQGPPVRPPPPYSSTSSMSSFLGSYNPVPAGLTTAQHHRAHTSPGVLNMSSAPAHYRASSDSNLPAMGLPRPGSGSGRGEEVGVAGSGSISILPPSLPESSSSTSAESLGINHLDDDSPLIFTEGSEDLPLISFDQSMLGDATTPSPIMDGYVVANTESDDGTGRGTDDCNSMTASAGSYVTNTLPSSVSPSPSPSPVPPVITSTLPLKSTQTPSPPPPYSQGLSSHLSATSQQNNNQPTTNTITSSTETRTMSKKTSRTSPTKTTKVADSVPSQKTTSTPTISAADSLAQALGFATIPPPSPPATNNSEKTNGETNTITTVPSSTTSSGRHSTTTDSLAEAFGFDTTPEDIENLIELMGPSSSDTYPIESGGVADSGYMTSNPMQTETYSDWTNFDKSN